MMQAEEYLEKIPMWTREKHSLTDIRAFLHEMGDPDRKLSIIHVAGTNGKGSVCAFLTSLYRNAGFRTGTFISPHLVTVRERFLLNNEMVSPGKLQAAFETVLETVNIMKEKGYSHPSYFEFLFYMAMALFADETPELVILETGLGGRLDATNVVENPLACVITSISLDHIMYLGDTIEAVAGEKAGIIKRQVPVIYDDTVPEASEVIRERAVQMASKAYPVGKGDFSILETKDQGLSIRAEGEAAQAFAAAGPLVLEIPFEAPYQAENAMLAVKTAVQNAELNHVEDRFTALCGNLTDRVEGTYDIVVANIVADIVITLTKDMQQFLAPSAVYLMSGIIDTREQDVLQALEGRFEVIARREEKGWVALAAKTLA